MMMGPTFMMKLAISLIAMVTWTPGTAFAYRCSSYVGTDAGYFMSPNYPRLYDNNQVCSLKINAKIGYVFLLSFQQPFEFETRHDYLKISEHNPRTGAYIETRRWTGSTLPSAFKTNSSSIRLDFNSDSSNTRVGFNVSWIQIDRRCKQIVGGQNGTLLYSQELCKYINPEVTWNISVPIGRYVRLTFNETFDLGGNNRGCGESVEIFDELGNGSMISRGVWSGKKRPPILTSFGSQMFITVHRQCYIQVYQSKDVGFSGEWQAVSDCRSEFTNLNGHIISYGYPSNDNPVAQTCTWDILVPLPYHIVLSFQYSTNRYNCRNTQILDYSDHRDAFIPRLDWCDPSNSTENGTSVNHVMPLTSKIRVQYNNEGPGLFVSWTKGCGRKLSAMKGNLSSPVYGIEYPPNLDCEWVIEGDKDHLIHLDFQHVFDVEASNDNSCNYDYVEVFDSLPGGNLLRLGRFCGVQLPPSLVSSSKELVVRFHSDESKHGKGFFATWDTACGGSYTTTEGNVTSPRYPAQYPDNIDCRWEVQVPDGHLINLFFGQFSLELSNKCDADYLEVYDYTPSGNLTKKGRWCGQNMPPLQTSITSRMLLVFHSDYAKTYPGFHAEWDSSNNISGCDRKLSATRGNLSSPEYGIEYPPNLDCEWVIEGDKDHLIRLDFQHVFDVEASNDNSCNYDYVEVFDSLPGGNLLRLGRFCGVQLPPPLVSSSKELVVRFHSDESKHGKGFFATWDTGCGGSYTTTEGNVTSPRYPAKYPDNIDCRWEVQVPNGHLINLFFGQFSLEPTIECVSDYLEVYDYTPSGNLTKKGRWCGQNMPPLQTSITSRMLLVFHSDDAKTYPGFHAEWDSGIKCGENFHSLKGTFTSPRFPQLYPDNLRCRWEIHVTRGQRIKLEFGSIFDIKMDRDGCSLDGVEVLDSLPNGTLVSFGKWCNVRIPPVVYSTSSAMVVSFHSDEDKSGQGFSASWEAEWGCGDVFIGRAGHLLTPNYPSDYPEYEECRWEIAPTPDGTNKNVTLHFDPLFELESEPDCAFDYVEIHRDNDLIGRWCGTDVPPDITSDGKTLVVFFKSDMGTSGKGFFATWN